MKRQKDKCSTQSILQEDAERSKCRAATAQRCPTRPKQEAANRASQTISILSPRVVADLGKIGVLGATVMLGEALLACWGMARQRRALPRIPITYLLVRANRPGVGPLAGRMGGSATPSGDQFYRAVQQATPPGTRRERFAGTAPWLAFPLSGIPDRPIELGLCVADPNTQRRAETAEALRAMLQGQLAGAQIDSIADPLQAALRPDARLAWREYGLALPAHYPLRFLDDIAGSDLLGPLVAVLAPRGTIYTEAQIIVRPANRFALN